jgi:hypothetical protein
MPVRHSRYLLGEGPHLALWVAAEVPAHLQVDCHGPAACRQVMKPPPVPAVDPGRRQPALVAGRVRRTGPRRHQHGIPEVLDPVDLQVSQIREEHIQAAGILACQGMLHNNPRGRSSMISSWPNKIITKWPHPWARCYGIAITTSKTDRSCQSRLHDLCARAADLPVGGQVMSVPAVG